MNVWAILALTMLVPGLMKLFAAHRLFRYRFQPAGAITFVIHLLHGLLWSMMGAILFFGALFGHIELNLPLIISIPLCAVFLADRASAALESLWIAGVLSDDTLMKVKNKKKE